MSDKKDKWEYGNLRFIEEQGWVFIQDGKGEKIKEKDFTKVLNKLGENSWELMFLEEKLGYVFKREVS